MNEDVVNQVKSTMATFLDFTPRNCSLEFNQDSDNTHAPCIVMDLKVARNKSIETPNGRSLKDIMWSLTVYRGMTTNEQLKAVNRIGMLTYCPATSYDDYSSKEAGSVFAHLDSESFSMLASFAMSGRLPSSIRILFVGGGLCYRGDHEIAVWNVKPNKRP